LFLHLSHWQRKRCVLTLADAAEILKAEVVVAAPAPDAEVTGCFAADLMSDVLAFARPGSILLTGLATDQTIRTAAVRHLRAVFVVEGKQVGADMLEAAREEGIPLCRTPLSTYEACGLLRAAGLRPYRRGVPTPA
jgi:predicted transcriptional regulator